MNREQLYIYGDCETATYSKSEADSVMDAMEAKLKELEEDYRKISEMYIAEQTKAAKYEQRIKELEAALQKERDFGQHIALCADHDIEKLTSENALLKAQVPKWISVKDMLPNKGQHVLVVRTHRSLYPTDVVCWSEDYITNDIVTHWMSPPLPPTEETSTTEKNEAVIKQNLTTEKENG